MQASTSPARKRPRPGFYGDGDACCELQPLKASQRASTAFSDLPTEVLVCHVLNSLGSADLCTLMAVSSRLRDVQTAHDSQLWGAIVAAQWDSPLTVDAVALAGSHRAFALCKQASLGAAASGGGWARPCEFELQAVLARISSCLDHTGCRGVKPAGSKAAGGSANGCTCPGPGAAAAGAHAAQQPSCQVLFLLDGSGSVGDEEFTASTSFIARAASTMREQMPGGVKISVLQFSNDVRTEWEDGAPDAGAAPLDPGAFESTIRAMVRMNGGTNIAAALTSCGKLLKKGWEPVAGDAAAAAAAAEAAAGSAGGGGAGGAAQLPHESPRQVVVLITDGRVDGYQAREARAVAARLADEQPGTSMFAFGVGRGVDRAELLGIIGPAAPPARRHTPAGERYLDLFVKDDAPW